jgi:hypothetical protein
LLRPSNAPLQSLRPPSQAPAKAASNSLLFFLALVLLLGAAGAYWMKQGKSAREAAAPSADPPAMPSLRAGSNGNVAPLPVVAPAAAAAAAIEAAAAASASAAATSAPAASSSARAVRAGKVVTHKPAPSAKPAATTDQPEKPSSTLPDLL